MILFILIGILSFIFISLFIKTFKKKKESFETSYNGACVFDIDGTILQGLDDTITQMRVGDRWLVNFRGDLSFKEAKKSVPGRPRIPQGAEVDYDVEITNIPGMGDDFIADFE